MDEWFCVNEWMVSPLPLPLVLAFHLIPGKFHILNEWMILWRENIHLQDSSPLFIIVQLAMWVARSEIRYASSVANIPKNGPSWAHTL